MRLCWNAIVKNEIKNLPRLLDSIAPHISCYAVYDTESTDGTQDYIREYFRGKNIPGVVFDGCFVDFEQARNEALKLLTGFTYDYALLCDADMELVVEGSLGELDKAAYVMIQQNGSLRYHNTRFLKHGVLAQYVGVTHEYLSVPGEIGEITNWYFKDHATGSNRVNKVERDIKLLTDDLHNHPNNGRSHFYLAQSYRESGKPLKAIEHYKKTIELSTWDEEIWYSKLAVARCHRDAGDNFNFVISALDAYNTRPSRAEPLYDLSNFHRLKGENAIGYIYADAGAKIPYPDDLLFIESDIYKWKMLEEKSITGFYQPNTFKEGFDACDKVALMKEASHDSRELARTNLGYYLLPLSYYAKSWESKLIEFQSPDLHYTNANPSIVINQGKIWGLVRTVNYKIRNDGSYDMQGDNSIRTWNWIFTFDDNLVPSGRAMCLLRPSDLLPAKYEAVLGFEDMRLISQGGCLRASAMMREQNEAGNCEQWLVNINKETGQLSNAKKMPTPSYVEGLWHEKNWMPIVDCGNLMFMYHPSIVIRSDGEVVRRHENDLAVDHFSGGSQLISWHGGWVGIIHEARMDPAFGYSKRYYQHRFVYYRQDFKLDKVSLPFFFEGKQIEFCAGLAKHPRKNQFIITYSVNDACAKIATITDSDLEKFLWPK